MGFWKVGRVNLDWWISRMSEREIVLYFLHSLSWEGELKGCRLASRMRWLNRRGWWRMWRGLESSGRFGFVE